jgi:secondary thiamine-phosphate synthase enzyme
MNQAMHRLFIDTNRQGLVEITDQVCRWVSAQAMQTGLLTIWCRHTSASLLVQENADPDVRADLQAFSAAWCRNTPAIAIRTKDPTTCRRTSGRH